MAVTDSKDSCLYTPTIALSAKWNTYPDRFKWITDNGFALDYAPNTEDFDILNDHVNPFIKRGTPVRYHGFFPGYEIGHSDPDIADRGLSVHLRALEAMHDLGEQVITIHIALNPQDPIDPGRAVENLSILVDRARDLGITICLENLRRGPTSHPEITYEWAKASGAMITLDIGHAFSCQAVQFSKPRLFDFFKIISGRLYQLHLYEKETDRHYPPKDMSVLGPILDRLVEVKCSWWTIELDDYREALTTRTLLLEYWNTKVQ